MDNQIANPSGNLPSRNIETITADIITATAEARALTAYYALKIGKYLTEAKSLLPHGEWGKWLAERVNYSQSTANGFMKIYSEYGSEQISLFDTSKSQAIMNLPYTKVLKLIAVPEAEREEFIEENDVENMSTRELDKLIRERDEALKKAERAAELEDAVEKERAGAAAAAERVETFAANAEKLTAEVGDLQAKLTAAKEAEKKAKKKLKALKENPEIPQELQDKLRADAEAAAAKKAAADLQAQIDKANQTVEAANLAKQAAERDAAKAAMRAAELEKKLQMANPAVAEFKTVFVSAQENMQKLRTLLAKIEADDKALAAKLTEAFNAFVAQYTEVSK